MINKKKILCIIPARGGSKGIKNKNLIKIEKESLITITSKFAISCGFFDHIHLSTDNSKMKEEGIKNGIECSFLRPKYLSGDRVSDIPVLKYCTKKIEKKFSLKFDYVVMLQVTSPFRYKKEILQGIKMMISKKYDSVISLSKIDKKYHHLKQIEFDNNKIRLVNNRGKKIIARQQLNDTYIRNGVFYIFDKEKLIKNKYSLFDNSQGYIINHRIVNIDSIDDLKNAKRFYKEFINKKNKNYKIKLH